MTPYLDETLDPLLNVHGIRLESGDELSCDLVNEVVVGHMFPVLHDPNDACLRPTRQEPSQDKVRALYLCLMSSFLINPVVRLFALFCALDFR